MTDQPVDLKDIVEIAGKSVTLSMGREASTDRVPTTVYTKQSNFVDSLDLLSDKPLRRPDVRRQ